MPLPIFALAIPVIHSSGGWIASSAGAYIAGTLSTSWIHAFVLGNLGFLSNIGLVSAGSIFGAAVAGVSTLGGVSFLMWRQMRALKLERQRGGLQKISFMKLVSEVRSFERDSIKKLCVQIGQKDTRFNYDEDKEVMTFGEHACRAKDIAYEIDKDGREYVVFLRLKLKKIRFEIFFTLIKK